MIALVQGGTDFLRRRLMHLAAASLIMSLASLAQAEVLELEGIDAASRSISIVRKTPKGEKVLELEVAKNAGGRPRRLRGGPSNPSHSAPLAMLEFLLKRRH